MKIQIKAMMELAAEPYLLTVSYSSSSSFFFYRRACQKKKEKKKTINSYGSADMVEFKKLQQIFPNYFLVFLQRKEVKHRIHFFFLHKNYQ